MKTTIKDVAKLSGVSIATVSHVINQTKRVSASTEKKVLEAIRALHYAPDQTAKSFKTGKKNIIAFIVPDISNNYFSNIIESLESELSKHGYSLILANTKETKEKEIRQLNYMTAGIADGIVLASTVQHYSEIEYDIPPHFPVILIDRKIDGCPFDSINVSDTLAISQGMDALFAKGHTRIGYIGDLEYLSTARERLQAYKDSLAAHGIPFTREFVRHTSSLAHGAYDMTKELLANGCTALVVGNNLMTIDAFCYVANHQSACGNVAVLGYQHKELSHLFTPRIGTIVQNELEMGIMAGRQIISRIQNPDGPRKEIIISNQYIG